MKKLCFVLTVCLFISIITPFLSYAENEIKNLDNLIIYIKNQEYEKKNVFLKEGVLYTSLGSLAKSLGLNYEYKNSEEKLYVNGIEYDGNYYTKGQYVYVPFKEMCEYLGYYVDYNDVTCTLDVSGKPIQASDYIPTGISQIINNNQQTGGTVSIPGNPKGVVIPGHGIEGVVSIGTSIEDIHAAWGEPQYALNMDRPQEAEVYGELALLPDVGGCIEIIFISSPSYKTAEGIGVGSSFSDV